MDKMDKNEFLLDCNIRSGAEDLIPERKMVQLKPFQEESAEAKPGESRISFTAGVRKHHSHKQEPEAQGLQ